MLGFLIKPTGIVMTKVVYFVFFVCFNFCNIAFSQTLKVDEETSKPTKIIFNMEKNRSAEIYKIENSLVDTGMTYFLKPDGSFGFLPNTSVSNNLTFLCTTPASFLLDKGFVQLQVGKDSLSCEQFVISATGGTQEWDIRPSRDGLILCGALLMTAGFTTAVTAFTIAIIEYLVPEEGDNPSLATGIGFAGLCGGCLGIPMVATGTAKATLVKSPIKPKYRVSIVRSK